MRCIHKLEQDILGQWPVFHCYAVYDDLDQAGRTLLEGRSLDYPVPDSEYRLCSYRDRRSDARRPMNVGSLKYLLDHKTQVMDRMRKNRDTLVSIIGWEQWQSLPIIERVHALAFVGFKAPVFEYVQDLTCTSGLARVPPEIANLAKISYGLNTVAMHFKSSGYEIDPTHGGRALYTRCDSMGLFIGRKEACAGAPRMLITFFDDVLDIISPCVSVPEIAHARATATHFGLWANYAEVLGLLHELLRQKAKSVLPSQQCAPDVCEPSHVAPYGLDAVHIANTIQSKRSFMRAVSAFSIVDIEHLVGLPDNIPVTVLTERLYDVFTDSGTVQAILHNACELQSLIFLQFQRLNELMTLSLGCACAPPELSLDVLRTLLGTIPALPEVEHDARHSQQGISA